ncbi:MAG TPA: glycerol-3-phosphate 1-O-acyltransferase PlsY [Vicinamibacteria bacterium]
MLPTILLLAAVSYLLGSIPFSYLVARSFGVGDVRQVGSGNVGATNVMRSAGKAAGVLAFLLDAAKGAAATLLVSHFGPEGALSPSLAAIAAVLGHVFPVWLRFRGGKGVATGVGAFFPLAPLAAALSMVVFAVTLAASRFVSVSSVVAAVSLPILAALFGAPLAVTLAAAFCVGLIVWKHRPNLERLAAGAERRVGTKT